MAKSRADLLREAKKRQKSRRRALKELGALQDKIPAKVPGVPAWALRGAKSRSAAEIAQLAFTNRILEDALIANLQGQSGVSAPASEIAANIDLQELQEIAREIPEVKRSMDRSRTDNQKVNDSILSDAFKNANKRARKKDGSFKAGWDQSRVAKIAWKECTKERKRLGLCGKKMNKRK